MKLDKPNIHFAAADIVNYKPALQKIDFITLFDVIEHIPMEMHSDLFKNIAAITGEETVLIINLPNPDYIEYDRLYHAEQLQIIDQPVPLSFILKNLDDNGLQLLSFKNYSIWVEHDYQIFVITKKKVFTENKLSDKRSFLQKAIKKIQRTYVGFRYKY